MENKQSVPMRLGRLVGWNVLVFLLTAALVLGNGVGLGYAQEPATPEKGQIDVSSLQGLVSSDRDLQLTTLQELVDLNNGALLPVLTALNDGTLHIWRDAPGSEKIVIILRNIEPDGRETISLLDPLTGQELGKLNATDPAVDEKLEMVGMRSGEVRLTLRAGLDRLRLFDPDVEVRRAAAVKIGNAGKTSELETLERALSGESNELVRHDIETALNRLRLADPEPEVRRAAAIRLGEIKGMRALSEMKALLTEEPVEESEAVKAALKEAIEKIESYQGLQTVVGAAFNGFSLASVLFMLGLGLAITYGLMGVINMAHGEMLMIGGYTAFVIQEVFAKYLPPYLHDSSYFVSLPVSFVVTAAVGFFIERTVIRYLYGRPLETLLATWGIGMFLQQAARWYFGDLTSVNTPTFLRRGVEPMVGLVLPYTRIFIMLVATVSLVGVYLLLSKTRMGLLVRAVTQNRPMSSCVGIATHKVDSWTFAFGTGLAGVAGSAISVIGSVDPEVGKNYIVEAFMVVVVGGVGKLAGTVVSALGIGVATKILEPIIAGTGGSIYAKLFVLATIILFLQVRPTGLFPAKGRAAEVGT
jgi:urea transport system permease protein